jgi:hypothetical protein
VEATAKAVVESASIGIALSTSREEGFGAAATSARADVVLDRSEVAQQGREISSVIEDHRNDDGALERALQSVAKASATRDKTVVLTSARKG